MLVLLFLLPLTQALIYYYSPKGTRKCFYTDLHKDTILIGRYKLEISHDDISFHIPSDKREIGVIIDVEEVFNKNNRVVRQRGFAVGQFSFNALDSGQHRICLTSKSFFKSNWFGKNPDSKLVKDSKFTNARIGIEFVHGDTKLLDRNFQDIKERIQMLNNKLLIIQREQLNIRQKEETFRNLSERTCSTVVNWMMIQLGTIFLIFIYQVICYSKVYFANKRKLD